MAERPLTLDEMAAMLLVSRASISTNARMSVAVGMVEHVSLPGDRRDYYAFGPRAWEHRLQVGIPTLQALRRIAEQGLAAVGPENALARERLREAIDFCEFYEAELLATIERWRERVARRAAAAPSVAGAADRGT